MSSRFFQALLLLGFLYLEITLLLQFVGFSNGDVVCMERERRALLNFKRGLTDPGNRLSSWVEGNEEEDCCKWSGVGCNNRTGHVVKLDLRNLHHFDLSLGQGRFFRPDFSWSLGGEINPCLLELKQLNYLDLSLNNFSQIHIPEFIGSFQRLRYLNLSYIGFQGKIPPQLGNLSNLNYLDLRQDEFLNVDSIQWLSHLSSLQYLDLRFMDLSKASADWLHVVNMLPSLRELRLSGCSLGNVPASVSYLNFTSLVFLDLSYNGFNCPIPGWIFNLSNSLVHLDLSFSSFTGPISSAFEKMTSLSFLDLRGNGLQSVRWRSMGGLCNLRKLEMSENSELRGIVTKIAAFLKNS